MSLTGLIWFALFSGLSFASLRRPVWAALGYLMVFFASPVFWWFGGGLLTSLTLRWSFIAALILAIANLATWQDRPALTKSDQKFFGLLLLFAVNAFLINALLADYPPESNKVFDILWKGCLAAALIYLSIRSHKDLDLFLFGCVVGCGFVAYQVIFNDQGSIEHGRLEGIHFPGAEGSNATAAVLSMGLVIAGYFVMTFRDKRYGWISLAFAPLILETILRCNSRGSYLGLIASAITILAISRGVIRKRAAVLCVVGLVAVLSLANDENIWNRFASIFVGAEERDNSAAERLDYWKAAIKMIGDHPFGSGGEAAFTSPLGVRYIAHFLPVFRSVHNGPLDIAAGWGVQGLFLLTGLLTIAALSAMRTTYSYLHDADESQAFLGTVIVSTMLGQLTCSMFTSILDGEWFLWLAVCCLAYSRVKIATDEMDWEEDAQSNSVATRGTLDNVPSS